jgi:hypothetical protein
LFCVVDADSSANGNDFIEIQYKGKEYLKKAYYDKISEIQNMVNLNRTKKKRRCKFMKKKAI